MKTMRKIVPGARNGSEAIPRRARGARASEDGSPLGTARRLWALGRYPLDPGMGGITSYQGVSAPIGVCGGRRLAARAFAEG